MVQTLEILEDSLTQHLLRMFWGVHCKNADIYCSCSFTGRLDAELVAVSKRVSNVLLNLPRDITPVNLEELRRVKQCLVELESKADNLR